MQNLPFGRLSWRQQASSISATVLQLERAVSAHVVKAAYVGRDPVAVRLKCVRQLTRMLLRII